MFHVPHLFEICVLVVGGAANGLIYWLLGRRIDDRFNGYHEHLADFEDRLREDFSSHIQTAKDQLTGMDRRVCFNCKRLVTKFQNTPQGALCPSCEVKLNA